MEETSTCRQNIVGHKRPINALIAKNQKRWINHQLYIFRSIRDMRKQAKLFQTKGVGRENVLYELRRNQKII